MNQTLIFCFCASWLYSLGVSELLCGQYQNLSTTPNKYTFNTNLWGEDGTGAQCMNVSTTLDQNNRTSFSTTWSWKGNASKVHSYSNINLNAGRSPVQISNLSALNAYAKWNYGDSKSQLEHNHVIANVVIDTFLDPNQENSTSTTKAKYEVMIWLGIYGGNTPVGYDMGSNYSHRVDGAEFHLYRGPNDYGQEVFSWLPKKNATKLKSDFSPLIHFIWRHGFFSEDNYLGVVQFGTEARHTSGDNVTFTAEAVSLEIVEGTPKSSNSMSRVSYQVSTLALTVLLTIGWTCFSVL